MACLPAASLSWFDLAPSSLVSRQVVWLTKDWLDSLHVTELLAESLLEPLRQEDRDPELERTFIQALGEHQTSQALHPSHSYRPSPSSLAPQFFAPNVPHCWGRS